MNKYCLPIIKSSNEEVLQEIQQSLSSYDFFEIWVDYIENIDEKFIKGLIDRFGGKLIVVFRRLNFEGSKISKEKRLRIISTLEHSQAMVDLDIYDQKGELDNIKDNKMNLKTIVSYHNYQETPDDNKLKEIIDTMKIYDPVIIKVATKCNSPKDGLRLLDLLLKMQGAGVRSIILGMGHFGIITRIFGTIFGNEMIFAPKDKSQSSAPGQLTKQQLEAIFGSLGV